MTTLRGRHGVTVLRPERGDLVLAHRGGADAATVLRDPGGVVATAIRLSAAKDRRRKEEKQR